VSTWRQLVREDEEEGAMDGYRRAATALSDKVQALKAVATTGTGC
jgi:hypothetical protein